VGTGFELVVNFGRDADAVAAATAELEQHPAVETRGVQLPVTPPYVTSGSYIEFSVHPRRIGYPDLGPPKPFKASDLTKNELTAVGEQLYGLLRRFYGYEAAIVGWDPEPLVELVELETEWVADGTLSRLDGLVLADSLVRRWEPQGFEPFAAGYSWLPYGGTANIL
jgi:hypothetical protein